MSGLPRTASRALDTVLDRTVVPGFSRVGYAVRTSVGTFDGFASAGRLSLISLTY